ncbi:MAG: S16 family serine protease [Verrucomicrobiota bacterium]|nr:S16 family serine protease [Verrucomicrobiota bacterium]
MTRIKTCLPLLALFILCSLSNAQVGKLKSKQTRIKGLLVRPLANGEFAGMASQMNATATPSNDAESQLRVLFNQRVGKDMHSALNEVIKHLRVKHDSWPSGYEVEIAFEDRFTLKDGPSAAVPCALLLDSLITGNKIDPSFAVTGDMNADGSIQPVGGVPAKVRGAYSKDCKIVAIPLKNARALSDLVILSGIEPVSRIQVFTVKHFREASALASLEKNNSLTNAVNEFAKVQNAIARYKPTVLRNVRIQNKLREIIQLAPNHLSARLCLELATGKGRKTLSLLGSLESTEQSASVLLDAARSGAANGDALAPDELGKAINNIKRIRLKLDKRVWPYADSIQDFGKLVRTFKTSPPKSISTKKKKLTEIQLAAERIENEAKRIRNNKEIMEELIQK